MGKGTWEGLKRLFYCHHTQYPHHEVSRRPVFISPAFVNSGRQKILTMLFKPSIHFQLCSLCLPKHTLQGPWGLFSGSSEQYQASHQPASTCSLPTALGHCLWEGNKPIDCFQRLRTASGCMQITINTHSINDY